MQFNGPWAPDGDDEAHALASYQDEEEKRDKVRSTAKPWHEMTPEEFERHPDTLFHGTHTAMGLSAHGTGFIHAGTKRSAEERLDYASIELSQKMLRDGTAPPHIQSLHQHAMKYGLMDLTAHEQQALGDWKYTSGGMRSDAKIESFQIAPGKEMGATESAWEHGEEQGYHRSSVLRGRGTRLDPMSDDHANRLGGYAGHDAPRSFGPPSDAVHDRVRAQQEIPTGVFYRNESEDAGSLSAMIISRDDVKTHRDFIVDAIREGKQIPQHNVEAYPELRRFHARHFAQPSTEIPGQQTLPATDLYGGDPVVSEHKTAPEPKPRNIGRQMRLF